MASKIKKVERKKPCKLIKKFSYGEKVVYEGTYRKALSLIPPSKEDQYQIIFKEEELG